MSGAGGPPCPFKTGTSEITTCGWERSRTFNRNEVPRRTADRRERLAGSSGITTVTKSPSSLGIDRTYSSTVVVGCRPPGRTSSSTVVRQKDFHLCDKSGGESGACTWIALKSPPVNDRTYPTASAVA